MFDFWLKLKNKGGVDFFEWQEEFHNAGQIFTPVKQWNRKKGKILETTLENFQIYKKRKTIDFFMLRNENHPNRQTK